jgi:hypothetical protein
MSFARRLRTPLLIAAGGAVAVALASPSGADPDFHNQSATSVIDQFQHEGYAVQVNGSPVGDTSLLTTCTVTSVDKPGDGSPDPTTTTVNLSVACPITHR